jgi:hypothetical protein
MLEVQSKFDQKCFPNTFWKGVTQGLSNQWAYTTEFHNDDQATLKSNKYTSNVHPKDTRSLF